MNGHHLVMGTLTDFLSGDILDDTHDERYRQKIARMLVEEKGYRKSEIVSRYGVELQAGKRKAFIQADFLIILLNKKSMLIKYAPGSLVTRRRPSLAISRLVSRFQVPIVVITNGEDAEVVSGSAGKVIGNGLDSLPNREQLLAVCHTHRWKKISSNRVERESRLAYAYEVDDSCPCDDSVCRILEKK